jgi:uncharacterized protein YfkK (UPF0435 family)
LIFASFSGIFSRSNENWDFQSLSQILQKLEFINIRRYDAEKIRPVGYEDFSTYKIANTLISLNVEATKKTN